MDDIAQSFPINVDQAVQTLTKYVSFSDKVRISLKEEADLSELMPILGSFISEEFRLPSNPMLIESCQEHSGQALLNTDDAQLVIIREFWRQLKEFRF